jgi:hypothetical protein
MDESMSSQASSSNAGLPSGRNTKKKSQKKPKKLAPLDGKSREKKFP